MNELLYSFLEAYMKKGTIRSDVANIRSMCFI